MLLADQQKKFKINQTQIEKLKEYLEVDVMGNIVTQSRKVMETFKDNYKQMEEVNKVVTRRYEVGVSQGTKTSK